MGVDLCLRQAGRVGHRRQDERVRPTGAALVDEHDVASGVDVGEQPRQPAEERRPRLARPTGKREERVRLRRVGLRRDDGNPQADHSTGRVRPILWHLQGPAHGGRGGGHRSLALDRAIDHRPAGQQARRSRCGGDRRRRRRARDERGRGRDRVRRRRAWAGGSDEAHPASNPTHSTPATARLRHPSGASSDSRPDTQEHPTTSCPSLCCTGRAERPDRRAGSRGHGVGGSGAIDLDQPSSCTGHA